MKRTQILSAISFALVASGPACSAKFVQIGDEDAGTGVKCVYNGVVHNLGSSFKSSDGCNTCTCASDGTVDCTLMACTVGGSSGIAGGTSVGCLYDGVNYSVGTNFKSSDGCNTCSCTTSGIACTTMACAAGGASGAGGSTGATCLYNGVNYPAGTSFKSTDGCNTCGCTSDGLVACTLMACGFGGASAAGGSTSVSKCSSAADCTGALPALCQVCADGSSGCAHFECNSGVCQVAYCGTTTCNYNGVSFAAGTTFKASDGCNVCSCGSDGKVNCSLLACGVGGASGAGGATGVTCSIVPLPIPACGSTKPILLYDSNGCPKQYVCPTCPAINIALPNCGANVTPVATTDVNGCVIGYSCQSCPSIDLALPYCGASTTAVPTYDANGCVSGYKCPTTCPLVSIDIACPNYQVVTDPTTGCTTGAVCTIPDAGACPAIAKPLCTTGTPTVTYDATGCVQYSCQ